MSILFSPCLGCEALITIDERCFGSDCPASCGDDKLGDVCQRRVDFCLPTELKVAKYPGWEETLGAQKASLFRTANDVLSIEPAAGALWTAANPMGQLTAPTLYLALTGNFSLKARVRARQLGTTSQVAVHPSGGGLIVRNPNMTNDHYFFRLGQLGSGNHGVQLFSSNSAVGGEIPKGASACLIACRVGKELRFYVYDGAWIERPASSSFNDGLVHVGLTAQRATEEIVADFAYAELRCPSKLEECTTSFASECPEDL
jgi:hypothetical protein